MKYSGWTCNDFGCLPEPLLSNTTRFTRRSCRGERRSLRQVHKSALSVKHEGMNHHSAADSRRNHGSILFHESRMLRRYSAAGMIFPRQERLLSMLDYGGCPSRIVGHTNELKRSRSRQTRDRWRIKPPARAVFCMSGLSTPHHDGCSDRNGQDGQRPSQAARIEGHRRGYQPP
jgi:hypothetical protein